MSNSLKAQLEAILAQAKPAEKGKSNDNGKKFTKEVLQTKFFNPTIDVAKGQKTAKYTVRLLPSKDDTTPFPETKVHTGIKYYGEWTRFVCLKEFGENCPLCQTENGHRISGDKEEAKKFRASEFYVIKLIDRAKEEEGPKFWRFRKNYKGMGAFDKIAALADIFGEAILDPENGYDLVITCGLDDKNNMVITNIVCVEKSPLSKDPELAKAWQEDATTWQDVFSKKSVEYLTQIVEGKAAYWDKAQKKMIFPGGAPVAGNTANKNVDNTVDGNPLLKDESYSVDDDNVEADTEVNEDELPF